MQTKLLEKVGSGQELLAYCTNTDRTAIARIAQGGTHFTPWTNHWCCAGRNYLSFPRRSSSDPALSTPRCRPRFCNPGNVRAALSEPASCCQLPPHTSYPSPTRTAERGGESSMIELCGRVLTSVQSFWSLFSTFQAAGVSARTRRIGQPWRSGSFVPFTRRHHARCSLIFCESPENALWPRISCRSPTVTCFPPKKFLKTPFTGGCIYFASQPISCEIAGAARSRTIEKKLCPIVSQTRAPRMTIMI